MGIISKQWMNAYHTYVVQALAAKQANLVSGTNIKTINGQSILGEGNLDFMSLVAANSLPEASNAYLNKIYLVPSRDPDQAANNIKEEWVVVSYKIVTMDNVDYPVELKDNAIGIYSSFNSLPEPPAPIQGVYANALVEVLTNPTVAPTNDFSVFVVYENEGYRQWQPVSTKVADAYKVDTPNGNVVYVRSGNQDGWVNESTLTTVYAWELVGSSKVDLSNYYTKDDINGMISVEDNPSGTADRLILTKNNKRFFVNVTELSEPTAPTITTDISSPLPIVINNTVSPANISINKPASSTAYYRVQNNDESWGNWIAINGNSFTLSSGLTNGGSASESSKTIQLKSILNGEETKPANYRTATINFKAKVATPNLTLSYTNKYSTSATITITKSVTSGATTYYKEGSGPWVELSENSKTFTATETRAANYYQVKAEKDAYIASATAGNNAFELNAKKMYYGAGPATLANEADIKALASSGGSKNQDNFNGSHTISYTPGQYLWFCASSGTITSITANGYPVPFDENYVTVAGYRCYKVTDAVARTATDTFNVNV